MLDTNALIRYLGIKMGSDGDELLLSDEAKKLITTALNGDYPVFLTSISIVEIWAKIGESESTRQKLIQTTRQLYEEENLRVTDLGIQTLATFNQLPTEAQVKEHDKVILAAALEYGCNTIITSDGSIIDFCKDYPDLKLQVIS